jgi:hypothetical protein
MVATILVVEQLSPALRKIHDELPETLQPYLLSLPPRIPIRDAMKIGQFSRGYLYDRAGEGKITLLKSGSSHRSLVLVETVSLLKHMASMTLAVIKPKIRKPKEQARWRASPQ